MNGELAMAIKGTSGDDNFRGRLFAEEVLGFAGNDFINGSPGADTLDGGSDIDSVDYLSFDIFIPFPLPLHSDAIDVDLQRPVQFGGFAEGDVLIDIENISGSKNNDVIRGSDADNLLQGNAGDDTLEGRDGDDVLRGDIVTFGITFNGSGNDHLDGGADNDQLFGDEGEDILIGGANDDLLFGGDGADTLSGGLDDDELSGGEGNDTLFGDPGLDRLFGDAGVDTASYANSIGGVALDLALGTGSAGDAQGDLFIGIENVTGSAFADTLIGSSAANVVHGGANSDILAGLGGADTLNGGSGSDTATYAASSSGVAVDLANGIGTSGDANGDTLISIENLIGSNFTDALVGNDGANTLDGAGGVDFLLGGFGNDLYIVDNPGDGVGELAGRGSDEVRTSVSYTLAAGADVEILRTTNDNGTAEIDLTGNAANNQIIGNNGDNFIDGGAGVDQLSGRGGNDLYFVDNANDSVSESAGQGLDEVRTSVSFTLTAGADVENLRTIDDDGAVAIDLAGNETGNVVRGNNGANVINGGAGDDELTGLGGQDAFLFDTALDAATNVDVIVDFSVADDTIRLDDAVFSVFATGGLAAERFVVGAAAQDGNDNIIYDDATGSLLFDVDGNGTAAAIQFAQLSPGLALTNNDFLVV
jgi:Ca2+-binding RTX toxin-like protein